MDSPKVWIRSTRGLDEKTDFERKLRNTLNKLTGQFYEKLSNQIQEMCVSACNTEYLDLAVTIIWEKAVTDHKFVKMYADLCAKLQSVCPSVKMLLLPKCQKGLIQPKLDVKEDCFKQKQMVKGNIKFIAELLRVKIVDERIILVCLMALSKNLTEERLESFCYFVTLVTENLTNKQMLQKLVDTTGKNIKDDFSARSKILFKNLSEDFEK